MIIVIKSSHLHLSYSLIEILHYFLKTLMLVLALIHIAPCGKTVKILKIAKIYIYLFQAYLTSIHEVFDKFNSRILKLT